MSHEVSGKHIVVIGGGGQGNGRAIVRRLHAQGARVFIVDSVKDRVDEAVQESRAEGGLADGMAEDVTSAGAADRVLAAASQVAPVDALVTVVGGHGAFAPWAPAHECSDETWDLIFELNLGYVFRFVRAAISHWLEEARPGVIVSVGSIAGVTSSPRAVAYGAAKAGLVSLAKTVAVEYARSGIRMNVVSLGAVATPAGKVSQVDAIAERIPLGRVAESAEVGAAVTLLLGSGASYITGHELVVDGGATSRFPFVLPNTDPSMAG